MGNPLRRRFCCTNESCHIVVERCNTYKSEAAIILFFTSRNGKTATIEFPAIPLDRNPSQMPKAIQQIPATTKLAMMVLLSQGYFRPPSCRANTSITEPAINKMNPSQSTWMIARLKNLGSPGRLGYIQSTSTMITTPHGTL
jgi:hypothetical protein